jgi:hypothetical protein
MEKKNANPGVVGLAGFGLTTLLLQLHNLGLVSWGPVLGMGIIFGGLAQFIAGFQEQKLGNNFGYSAFVSYGAFWIGLSIIKLLNHFDIYPTSGEDLGYYLLAWGLYSLIMLIASLRVHKAMTITFLLLEIGFILLVLEHFGFPQLKVFAAIVLILCAFSAWYMMAGIIINDLAGKTVLPMGSKFVK